ncbi:MAG: hypothetical protein MJZ82_05750 [Paludibacteraceae bacterium]|nr:hypothetical protein [Paludibacteraceae bacterium]
MKKFYLLLAAMLLSVALFPQETHRPNYGGKDNPQFNLQNSNALELYGTVGYNLMSLADKSSTLNRSLTRDMWVNVGLNYLFSPAVKFGIDVIYNPETNIYNRLIRPGSDLFDDVMNLSFGPVVYYSPLDEYRPERRGKWFAFYLFAGLHADYYRLNAVDLASVDAPWGMSAQVGLQFDLRVTNYFKFIIKASADEKLALGLGRENVIGGSSPKFFQVAANAGIAISFPSCSSAQSRQNKKLAKQNWMVPQDTVYLTDTIVRFYSDTIWMTQAEMAEMIKIDSLVLNMSYNRSDDQCPCEVANEDIKKVIYRMKKDTTLTIGLHGYAILPRNNVGSLASAQCVRQIQKLIMQAGIAPERVYILSCRDRVISDTEKKQWVEVDIFKKRGDLVKQQNPNAVVVQRDN